MGLFKKDRRLEGYTLTLVLDPAQERYMRITAYEWRLFDPQMRLLKVGRATSKRQAKRMAREFLLPKAKPTFRIEL